MVYSNDFYIAAFMFCNSLLYSYWFHYINIYTSALCDVFIIALRNRENTYYYMSEKRATRSLMRDEYVDHVASSIHYQMLYATYYSTLY